MTSRPEEPKIGEHGDTDGDDSARTETIIKLAVAAGIVVVFVVLKLWLLNIADDGLDEHIWSRYTLVAGAFDSTVTVVIGWLFGREVHRKAYEAAAKSAQHARESDRLARAEVVKSHAAHLATMGQAAKSDQFAKAIRAIVSTVPDGGRTQHDQERILAQVDRALDEFFPPAQITAAAGTQAE